MPFWGRPSEPLPLSMRTLYHKRTKKSMVRSCHSEFKRRISVLINGRWRSFISKATPFRTTTLHSSINVSLDSLSVQISPTLALSCYLKIALNFPLPFGAQTPPQRKPPKASRCPQKMILRRSAHFPICQLKNKPQRL